MRYIRMLTRLRDHNPASTRLLRPASLQSNVRRDYQRNKVARCRWFWKLCRDMIDCDTSQYRAILICDLDDLDFVLSADAPNTLVRRLTLGNLFLVHFERLVKLRRELVPPPCKWKSLVHTASPEPMSTTITAGQLVHM